MKIFFPLLFVSLLILMGQGCIKISSITHSNLGIDLPPGQESVGVDDLAPEFVLKNFDGKIVKLSDFKGKPVFIDFWAGWCPFCVGELAEIEKVHQQYGDKLVILGIHRTETESIEVGKAFAEDNGITYQLIQVTDGSVFNAFTGGRPFMPVSVFIDAEGVIRDVRFGPKNAEQINESLSKIIE